MSYCYQFLLCIVASAHALWVRVVDRPRLSSSIQRTMPFAILSGLSGLHPIIQVVSKNPVCSQPAAFDGLVPHKSGVVLVLRPRHDAGCSAWLIAVRRDTDKLLHAHA